MGRLIDHFGRQNVRWSACAQSLLYVLLAVAASRRPTAVTLVGLAALAGAALPPIAPVVRTLLREIFADASVRETAYVLESVAQEAIWIVGPLVVALVITVISPDATVLMLGAVGLLGA